MKNFLVGPALIPESARPIVIRVTEFDEESAAEFSTQMSKAHETGQPVIPVVIDSYGGEAYALLSMIADIQNARLPVVTIVEGKAMSCGAMLFCFGAQRYIAPHATLMLHDISADSVGKNEELKANAEATDRLQILAFGLMDRQCGQKEGYFNGMLDKKKHADWYLAAGEAVTHRLATHIGVPEMRTTISISMELLAPVGPAKPTKHVLTNRGKRTKVTSKRKTKLRR